MSETLAAPGQPLESGDQGAMRGLFGVDFSRVRIHADPVAAQSAAELGARAYAAGPDVVFGRGQYSPGTVAGQRLLAHELTHVLQQGRLEGGRPPPGSLRVARHHGSEGEADRAARSLDGRRPGGGGLLGPAGAVEAPALQLADFQVGRVTVHVDYGNLVHVPAADRASQIETLFTTYTGQPPAAIHASVAALTSPQLDYVLHGIDLLIDNTTAAHAALDRVDAVQRVIARSGTSALSPFSASFDFEREVMRASGWVAAAVPATLTAPTGTALTSVQTEFNPPQSTTAPTSTTLDTTLFQAELPPALEGFITAIDPANWTTTGTQSIGTLQTVGDLIQQEAISFFAPYADASLAGQIAAGFQYSAQLSATQAITPDQATRLGYLRNRAEIVGRMTRGALAARISGRPGVSAALVTALQANPATSIFEDANFQSSETSHLAELETVVTTLEGTASVAAAVNRLIQTTGRTNRSAPMATVAVTTEYNAGTTTECEARWKSVDTLSHELVHVMVHPSFPAAAPSVRFGQIVREGFTEVMGLQLFDHIRARAAADTTFRSRIQAGVASVPCAAPSGRTPGYGAAGPAAERIRTTVGDDNFRSAYFLGAINLVGL